MPVIDFPPTWWSSIDQSHNQMSSKISSKKTLNLELLDTYCVFSWTHTICLLCLWRFNCACVLHSTLFSAVRIFVELNLLSEQIFFMVVWPLLLSGFLLHLYTTLNQPWLQSCNIYYVLCFLVNIFFFYILR